MTRLVRDSGTPAVATTQTRPRAAVLHPPPRFADRGGDKRRLAVALCAPSSLATSEGENIVTSALDLKAGDNVVVDELHYNTSFVLYRHLEATRGIALRIVKHRDGRVATEDFSRAVDNRTRIVSVAWVSHQNGFRHDMRPLADLAHAHGAIFYADAVRALGRFPADVRAAGVDCMTSGTYKWLLRGLGVSPFFVRRERLERIRVDRLGALHVEKELGDHRYEIYRTARKFEYATLPFAEIYQLGAALAYPERVGLDRIERHTEAFARELREGLTALGFRSFTPPDNRSSIVSVHLERNAARAREILDNNGVRSASASARRVRWCACRRRSSTPVTRFAVSSTSQRASPETLHRAHVRL